MNENEEWNEFHRSERPAYLLLRDQLGYDFLEGTPGDQYNDPKVPILADDERESMKQAVLPKRLAAAVRKINPWISDENLARVLKRMTTVVAAGTMEANAKVYSDLVNSITVEQDVGGGKKNQTVKLIDFENPEKNDFLVVRQFKVWGPKANIKPDLVVFVNGIPVGVIENKSPTVNDPIEKGIKDIIRKHDKGTGAPELFYYNQVLVSAAEQAAECSTIGASRRHFHAWKDPYPLKLDDLEKKLGRRPTPQDILLFGVFRKENLLDLIQNFIVFDPEEGLLAKKMARYQQFRTVNKAMARVKKASKAGDRGGIVWHWQGSGKSLTMLWLALKLRREASLNNPAIVIVTDRVQLDTQIAGTFSRSGFPNPSHAETSTELREVLKGGAGQTIITTIQKFLAKAGEKRGEFPVLSSARDIFVLVDEAHRTQYKELAANMRQALPNATFFGFTGTPIDKKDRSTPRVFGPYIDTYDIEESVEDKATVPIFYESRLPRLHVEGETLDRIFDRVFAELSDEERKVLRKRFANWQAITGAPQRVEKICLDLVEHYEKFIRPNGFKAQVVAVDRKTAVLYKKTLDRLKGPKSAVIISEDLNDPEDMRIYPKGEDERKAIVDRFKQPMDKDDLSIIIVNEMLLTGFDAPVEQVMYLDSQLKEHNLLQAIARVNRPNDGKTYGLIVDYFGVSDFLTQALDIFKETDVRAAMRPIGEEIPKLEARHRAAMRFFEKADTDDLDGCVSVLEPEEVRTDFENAFKLFAQSMDMIMPDAAANPYREDLRNLGKIRNAARLRFRDERMDLSDYGQKVRQLIEEYVRATGVDPLMKPISIMDKEFKRTLQLLSSDEAKASEMEHAIRYEIKVRRDENPVFYDSLREKLEKLIEEKKTQRLEMAKFLTNLEDLTKDAQTVQSKAKSLGLDNKFEYGVYSLLEQDGISEQDLKALAKNLFKDLDGSLVIDWPSKENNQREARKLIKRNLRANGCPEEKLEDLTSQVMDLARVHLRR